MPDRLMVGQRILDPFIEVQILVGQQMLKRFHRFVRNNKLIPLVISDLIGSIFTLLFFPIQKEIDQFYWDKQNKQIVNQDKISKRLNLLDEFISEYTKYNWCSIRVDVINNTNVIEEDPIVCYMNTSSRLLGIALKVRYYYDEDVNTKMYKFSELIQDYEADVSDGILEPDSRTKLNNLSTDIIITMQDHILLGLD